MFQEIPCMPSFARVMPVISLFIASVPFPRCYIAFPAKWTPVRVKKTRQDKEMEPKALVARRAFLGVTVTVILENFLDDLGLEFTVRAFGDLGQVKILDRIAVDVELEAATQRGEVGLLQRGRDS